MRRLAMCCSLSAMLLGAGACQDEDDAPAGGAVAATAARPDVEQIAPSIAINAPPPDAAKTASGLRYKRLVANRTGAQPTRGDTALVRYTGWRQETGQTFFSTQGRGQPIALDVAHAAPGFVEALELMHKGEKVMLWVPPGSGMPEAVVYEIEVVDVVAPPVVGTPVRAIDRSVKPGEPFAPARP